MKLKQILTWVWCFPQMLVGYIVKHKTKAKKYDEFYLYSIESGSVSLGTYIFLCPSHWDNEKAKRHEKGHTVQSYILLDSNIQKDK